MIYKMFRLAPNSSYWTEPTPGRLGERGMGQYVRDNGFGHEDWNFNFGLAEKGYINAYSYARPAEHQQNELFSILLYTWSPGVGPCAVGYYEGAQYFKNGLAFSDEKIKIRVNQIYSLVQSGAIGGIYEGKDVEEVNRLFRQELAYYRWRVDINNVKIFDKEICLRDINMNYYYNNTRMSMPYSIEEKDFINIKNFSFNQEIVFAPNDENYNRVYFENRKLIPHYIKERDGSVVRHAKEIFKRMHGKLFCEVCGFDFNEVFGQDFIEAHHKVPLSKIDGPTETQISDLAMVCSNCHRMLHRIEPFKTVEELALLLKPRT